MKRKEGERLKLGPFTDVHRHGWMIRPAAELHGCAASAKLSNQVYSISHQAVPKNAETVEFRPAGPVSGLSLQNSQVAVAKQAARHVPIGNVNGQAATVRAACGPPVHTLSAAPAPTNNSSTAPSSPVHKAAAIQGSLRFNPAGCSASSAGRMGQISPIGPVRQGQSLSRGPSRETSAVAASTGGSAGARAQHYPSGGQVVASAIRQSLNRGTSRDGMLATSPAAPAEQSKAGPVSSCSLSKSGAGGTPNIARTTSNDSVLGGSCQNENGLNGKCTSGANGSKTGPSGGTAMAPRGQQQATPHSTDRPTLTPSSISPSSDVRRARALQVNIPDEHADVASDAATDPFRISRNRLAAENKATGHERFEYGGMQAVSNDGHSRRESDVFSDRSSHVVWSAERPGARDRDRIELYMHEESAQRRALESQVEARICSIRREVHEVADRAARRPSVSCDASEFHASIRQEFILFRTEVSEVHAELARTCERLAQELHSIRGSKSRSCSRARSSSVTEASTTAESLRDEIRKQVGEAVQVTSGAALNEKLDRERLERLDDAILRESVARKDAEQKLLSTVQELVRLGQLDVEQKLIEQVVVQREAIASKNNYFDPAHIQRLVDDGCARQLSSLTSTFEKLWEEIAKNKRGCDAAIQAERNRCEEALCAHEAVVQAHFVDKLETAVGNVVDSVVQRSSQGLQTTRQDILDLRQEFNDKLEGETIERQRLADAIRTLEDLAPSCRTKPDVLALTEEQVQLRKAIESQADRLATLQQECREGLARSNVGHRENAMAVGDELNVIRQSFERLRQDCNANSRASDSVSLELAQSLVSGEVRNQLTATLSEAVRGEIAQSLEQEARLRKANEERMTSDVHGKLQEERHNRERENFALKSRVDVAEENIFADSGKREERDRDLRSAMKRLHEDVVAVKRHMSVPLGGSISSPHVNALGMNASSSGSISGLMTSSFRSS